MYKDVIYETAPTYDGVVPSTIHGAHVHVVESEDKKKYLRTDKDEITADNLGELLEFELPEWYINRSVLFLPCPQFFTSQSEL
jgi:hypothetical protein